MQTRSSYIPTLDGWRCIAISLVLLNHAYAWTGFGTSKLARFLHYPGITAHVERSGSNGVAVFFCISGFLITKRLVDQGVALESFYIRRAFRILPAALTYLSVIATLGAIGIISVDWRQIVAALFFYRNYLDRFGWFTAHYWSLSIEEQFYLVWPFLLALAGIRRSRLIAIIGIVGVLAWRQVNWPLPTFASYHTGMRLDSIMCGSVMALAWASLKPLFQKAPKILIPLAFAGFVTVDLWNHELQGVADSLQALFICLLLGSTIANPALWSSGALELPLLKWVGKLSQYSIYLWQQLFLSSGPYSHWQLPLRLSAALLLAFLSYRFIERPLLATGQRLANAAHPRQEANSLAEAQVSLR